MTVPPQPQPQPPVPEPPVPEPPVPKPPVSGLPADLAANPVLRGWLDFSTQGVVVIATGKVEYGQGVWTALAQIAAEELDVRLDRVRVAPVLTDSSPNEGVTSSSKSIEDSGGALRQACAQARQAFVATAAARLETDPAGLGIDDGEITTPAGGTGLSYWSLGAPALLDAPGPAVDAKPPSRWSVAGRSAPRLDIPDKVTGRPRFIHDLVLPGMLFGRVIRPPGARGGPRGRRSGWPSCRGRRGRHRRLIPRRDRRDRCDCPRGSPAARPRGPVEGARVAARRG